MVESTWTTRELVILEAAYVAMETYGDVATACQESVAALPKDVYNETIACLADGGFLDAAVTRTGDGKAALVHPKRLSPKGRQAIGQWPSGDVAEELVRTLQRLEETETDPERKSGFRRLRVAVGDVGKDIVVQTLAELVRTAGYAVMY